MYGLTTIALQSVHGKYVCAESSGYVAANRDEINTWEEFSVENVGDDKVGLKSDHGKYLCAEGNGNVVADRSQRRAWEEWEVIHFDYDKVALKSHHGKFLFAEKDGRLVANRSEAEGWEQFTLINCGPEPEIDEGWLEKRPEVAELLNKFVDSVHGKNEKGEDGPTILRKYADCIPEITQKLQEWIDDLQVHETAINATNTATTAVSVISFVALFTPFAAFGVAGLIGSGVAIAATGVGDTIANSVKAQKITEVAESKKDLMTKAEELMIKWKDLMQKIAKVGKIPIYTAYRISFGILGVMNAGAAGRVALQGDKMVRLMGLFRVWRAGELATAGGWQAIRGVSGAGSKALGFLGTIIGIWTCVDGWVNGNPTKNATVEMKQNFEESRKAILLLIDMLEGKCH